MAFNPQSMAGVLRNVERMSREEFAKMTKKFIIKKTTDPATREILLDKMFARKNTLRADFEMFLTELYRKRKGDPEGFFTFDEGWLSGEEAATGQMPTNWTLDKKWRRIDFIMDQGFLLYPVGKDYKWGLPSSLDNDGNYGWLVAGEKTYLSTSEQKKRLFEIANKAKLTVPTPPGFQNNGFYREFKIIYSDYREGLLVRTADMEEEVLVDGPAKKAYTSGLGPKDPAASDPLFAYMDKAAQKYRSNVTPHEELVPTSDNSPERLYELQSPEVAWTFIPKEGMLIRTDSDLVKGQQLRVYRHEFPPGKKFYRVVLRLRPKVVEMLSKSLREGKLKNAKRDHGQVGSNQILYSKYDEDRNAHVFSLTHPLGIQEVSKYVTKGPTWQRQFPGATNPSRAWVVMPVPDDDPYGYGGEYTVGGFASKGLVYMDLYIGNLSVGEASEVFLKEIQKAGAKGLATKVKKKPKRKDVKRRKYAQLLWAYDPHWKGYGKDSMTADLPLSEMKARLKELGFDKKRLKRVVEVESLPGVSSLVERGRWRDLTLPGSEEPALAFLLWSQDYVSGVVAMCQGGAYGVLERADQGLGIFGASAGSDLASGSADNITVRVVTKLQAGWPLRFGSVGGKFALILAPSIVDRLDSVFYNADTFGQMRPDSTDMQNRRSVIEDLGVMLTENASTSNEIVLRRGMSSSMILRVNAPESYRAALIQGFLMAGMTHVNGIPVEHFVISEKTCGAVYQKFVKPEGY